MAERKPDQPAQQRADEQLADAVEAMDSLPDSDAAGQELRQRGATNSNSGRGRNSAVGGAAGGSGGGGTGGLTDINSARQGILGAGNPGDATTAPEAGTGGGVAVPAGRGSDIDLASSSYGREPAGLSGGTTGGSRASDVAGGLHSGADDDSSPAGASDSGDSTPEDLRRDMRQSASQNGRPDPARKGPGIK